MSQRGVTATPQYKATFTKSGCKNRLLVQHLSKKGIIGLPFKTEAVIAALQGCS